MKERITMNHVAQRAGVHPTTVSLALRNHPSIPPATRARLRALADEMGYRPDPALNALTAYRHAKIPRRDTPPLAYLTHWDTARGWQSLRSHERFHAGAVARADALGYKLDHFWLGESGLTHQRMSDILSARGITGAVVASHLPGNDRPLTLDWRRISAVKIGCLPRLPLLHQVSNDYRAIVQMAMQRVMAAGYRRIGMVVPQWLDEEANLAWSAGFLAEQQRLEPEERIPIMHLFGAPTDPATKVTLRAPVLARQFAEWLGEHRSEVLLTKAQLVRPQLERLGLVVPRDIALVDIDLDREAGLAGVRHNCERVGALAVDLLVRQLHQNEFGPPDLSVVSMVEGEWVSGETLPPRLPHPNRATDGALARVA